jgi:hypothetical protein
MRFSAEGRSIRSWPRRKLPRVSRITSRKSYPETFSLELQTTFLLRCNELAEEDAANNLVAATAAEIDESLRGSNERSRPLGHLAYVIRYGIQDQWELDLDKDAQEALARAARIESIQDSIEEALPRDFGITDHITFANQSRMNLWKKSQLAEDADLDNTAKSYESINGSLDGLDGVTTEPGEHVQNKVKGMQWSFKLVCDSLFLIRRFDLSCLG